MGVALVVAVVAVVAVAVGMATTSGRRGAGTGTGQPSTAATGSGARPVTATTGSAPVRGRAVTLTSLDLVDTGRPVVSGGTVLAPTRDLPTEVWVPSGPGHFPLVVLVHGYDRGPLDYARFGAQLASSGYVVAAPSFPLEDPARGYPLDRTRLADEAADVSFVIGALEDRSGALHLVPGAVAVVGHSDGADVALLVGYAPGTVDGRVGAVVADAPDPMAAPPPPSAVPLLLVQGTEDSVVPYAASATVFAQVAAPTAYLTLVGADHLPPIAGGTPWTPVLDDAVARWLDATVAHRGPAPGPTTVPAPDPSVATVRWRP